MAQGTNIQTLLGATLSITATLPATYDAAGYGATISWTLIGQVENYGNYGGASNVVKFIPVDTGTVNKQKGSTDYGSMSLMMASLPSDVGQILLNTAFGSTAHYSIKLIYPLRTGEATHEIHYMDALIAKREFQDGTVDNIMKLAIDLEICRAPVIVAAT